MPPFTAPTQPLLPLSRPPSPHLLSYPTHTYTRTYTHHQQVFVLVAKGWTITQEYFAPSEWRGIILTLSAFYMTNSILLVLQVPLPPPPCALSLRAPSPL